LIQPLAPQVRAIVAVGSLTMIAVAVYLSRRGTIRED